MNCSSQPVISEVDETILTVDDVTEDAPTEQVGTRIGTPYDILCAVVILITILMFLKYTRLLITTSLNSYSS